MTHATEQEEFWAGGFGDEYADRNGGAAMLACNLALFSRALARAHPPADCIEFGANILLFVPLGVLLALILEQRHLVVPIAFLTSVTIESLQALMLEKRTPSVMDIIANFAGACLGLVIVAFIEWRRARREP